MRKIPVYRMKKVRVGYVKVSDRDFPRLNKSDWWAWWDGRSRYARRSEGAKVILLHREIISSAEDVHHRDGDGWNNQRRNLEGLTRREHCQKIKHKQDNASSRFVGVHWHAQHQKWCAEIRVNGIKRHLGLFVDEKTAARAYRIAKGQICGS